MVGRQALEIEFLKRGSEKRTTVEKCDYIRHCRPGGILHRRRMPAKWGSGALTFFYDNPPTPEAERRDHRCGDEKTICGPVQRPMATGVLTPKLRHRGIVVNAKKNPFGSCASMR